MVACGSAHHWGRVAQATGHEVRLIPAQYVKAFVKRHKNDAIDAEAIVEAVSRPSMRAVAVKDENQQAQAMMFRTREMFVKQRTLLINAVRAHLTEYRIVLPQQRRNGRLFVKRCRSEFDNAPETATLMIEIYLKQIEAIDVSRVTAFLRSTCTQFVWISLSKVLLFHNLVSLLLVSGKEGLAQGMFLYKISQECCD